MKRLVLLLLLGVSLAVALPSSLLGDSSPFGATVSTSGSTGIYNNGGVDNPAVSFTGITTNFTDGSWSLGWEFSTNNAINVTALGFYDAALTGGAQGLAGCFGCGQVGIYDSTGNLLVSGLVTASGTAVGHFYYTSVPATLLAAGQNYYVVGVTGNADYTWNTLGLGVDSNINFIQDAWVTGTTLTFPPNSSDFTAGAGGGLFGANFQETAAAVPEPSSLLLLGSALLGAFPFLRKRHMIKS